MDGQECHYRGLRDSNGDYTKLFYEVLAAKLGFVLIFEHVVFFIKVLIQWAIPDEPKCKCWEGAWGVMTLAPNSSLPCLCAQGCKLPSSAKSISRVLLCTARSTSTSARMRCVVFFSSCFVVLCCVLSPLISI